VPGFNLGILYSKFNKGCTPISTVALRMLQGTNVVPSRQSQWKLRGRSVPLAEDN
jgi:hypothetical protein